MYFVTPTYFRPMLGSLVGWIMLAILATSVCVSYGLVEAAISVLRKGRVGLGILLLVFCSVTWLVAAWVALLGPEALSLMKPKA